MTKIEVKIGRRIFYISENDLVLYNGSCAQVITQSVFNGWNEYPPKMSKKLFSDLIKLGFLYTNAALKERCEKHYQKFCTLYAFDIPAMVKAGYISKEYEDENNK